MSEVNPSLMQSFSSNRGSRGVHFYDSASCEFLDWSETMGAIKDKFPEVFYDRLVETIANYDPEEEFIAVSAGSGQLTIELFKTQTL